MTSSEGPADQKLLELSAEKIAEAKKRAETLADDSWNDSSCPIWSEIPKQVLETAGSYDDDAAGGCG